MDASGPEPVSQAGSFDRFGTPQSRISPRTPEAAGALDPRTGLPGEPGPVCHVPPLRDRAAMWAERAAQEIADARRGEIDAQIRQLQRERDLL
jgi:hypothetical protein